MKTTTLSNRNDLLSLGDVFRLTGSKKVYIVLSIETPCGCGMCETEGPLRDIFALDEVGKFSNFNILGRDSLDIW